MPIEEPNEKSYKEWKHVDKSVSVDIQLIIATIDITYDTCINIHIVTFR